MRSDEKALLEAAVALADRLDDVDGEGYYLEDERIGRELARLRADAVALRRRRLEERGPRVYRTLEGREVSLETLCRLEPEWAASRIRTLGG